MTVIALDEQKANPYDAQAGHKTLNYFSRLSALRAANSRGAGEAIWFNVHNYMESGSISNIFLVKGGKLLTPPTNIDLRDPAIARLFPRGGRVFLMGKERLFSFASAIRRSRPRRLTRGRLPFRGLRAKRCWSWRSLPGLRFRFSG